MTIKVTGIRITTGVREELNEFAAQAWRDGTTSEAFTDIREEPAATKGGPYGNTHAREAVAALDAAIAAEHARQEAEHGSPVPRADVERALIWGGILREQERRVAEKEEQIAAMRAPADAPSLARARAVTRLLALGLDGQEVAHVLADAARIVAGRGRLTSPEALAILADYVAPADASLEARAKALGRDIIDKLGPLAPAPPRYFRDTCIALVRAVDASRPAAKWDPVGGRPVEPTEADLLEGATMGSRPGLTEEQARRDFEAAIRDAVAKGGPYGNTHAREAVAALDAAIAAEHARQEAEHGSPVPRADVERALIWGGILREQERRVAEKEEQIAAMRAPADAPSLARARAVTRLLALGLDGQEVAHVLADAARIVAGRGRLTSPEALAILADYVAPADASLEARAKALGRIVRAAWVEVAKKEAKTVPGYVDLWEWLEIPDADTDREIGEQVVRAVDASRPIPHAAASARTLNVNALARCARAALRIEVPDVAAWEALPEAERVGWRAVVRCVLASTTPASRPGLTEEQAQTARFEPVIAAWLAYFDAMDRQNASGTAADAQIVRELRATANGMDRIVADVVYHVALARHRASRGETGPDDQTVCMAAAAKAGWAFYRETGRWTGPSPSDPEIAVEMLQWEADVDAAERAKLSRGGTGAVPTGLTSIMADAQQRPSTAPDPRATLHVGDPASLAEVVAASAREPHADVVLHALHVSGGAAAVEAVTKSDVEEGERLLAAHRRVNAIEDPQLRHAARVRLSMSYIDEQTAIERGARIDGADMVWPDGARYPRCLP